jgi:hypothetical protein
MAGKKITELPELGSTPAAGDWLPIVDVSDTSESAQGTTKKVLYSDVIPASGGGVESVTGEWVDNTDPLNPIIRPPYLTFVGKVSQSGTANPTISFEFENTIVSGIGSVDVLSFERISTGYYSINTRTSGGLSVDVFDEDNTFILATAGGSTYNDCFVVIKEIASSQIRFYNYGNGGGLQDEFTNMYFEIRYYQ